MATCQHARVGVLIGVDIMIVVFLIILLATTDFDRVNDPTKVRLGVTIAVLVLLNLIFFFKYCRARRNELVQVQGPPPQMGIYAIDPDVAHRQGHPNVNDHVIFTPANHQRFNQVDVVGRVEVFTWAVVDPTSGQLQPPSYDPPPAYKDVALMPAPAAPSSTNENGERPQDNSISGWDVCY